MLRKERCHEKLMLANPLHYFFNFKSHNSPNGEIKILFCKNLLKELLNTKRKNLSKSPFRRTGGFNSFPAPLTNVPEFHCCLLINNLYNCMLYIFCPATASTIFLFFCFVRIPFLLRQKLCDTH